VKYNRHSIRLNNFDYSNNGYYFVTICAHYRNNVFGEIVGARRDAPLINKNKSPLINENNNPLKINKDNIFGNESNDNLPKIKLNQNGKIINEIWKTLPNHHNVILDEFCIMPNHIHFILIIKNNLNENNNGALENNNKGASRRAPTQLGFVIGMFKTETTKQINKLNQTPGIQLWQRNYYEHIIRNEKEYLRIKEYIRGNPKNLGL
jgi:REP element-mobilizing transposase RayT